MSSIQELKHISDDHAFDSDEESDDDGSWNEVEEEQDPTKCLFCDKICESIEAAIKHLDHQHRVSLSDIMQKFKLDQYSYVKMINYIKTHNVIAEHFSEMNKVLWNDDKYLKPVEVDAWLMFDIEDLNESQPNCKTNDAHKIESLERQLNEIKNILNEKDVLIEQLLEQINEMKSSFHAWVERTTNGPLTEDESLDNDLPASKIVDQTHVAKIPINEDEPYFMTYAHFHIHYEMLSDTIRTNSYREAILQNKSLFENKNVLDLGCGTAILSMFSSQAGAKKVFAVDQSEIIYYAMDIAQRNDVKNIDFVKGRLENLELPLADGEKVDIIVSEFMGYFCLFEGMLDSVIHARDKYLKPGGLMLPNRCTINLLALGDEERHSEYIEFWNNVYGYDMSILQSEVLKEAIVETCRNEHVLSDPVIIADLNMHQVDYGYPNFSYDFELKIQKNGKFTAFVGYFDTFFDLPQRIEFTTGPHSTVETHWKQVIFYIKNPVIVNEGDIIRGTFHCSRGKNDARAIRIKIAAFDQNFYFNLN